MNYFILKPATVALIEHSCVARLCTASLFSPAHGGALQGEATALYGIRISGFDNQDIPLIESTLRNAADGLKVKECDATMPDSCNAAGYPQGSANKKV